VSLRSAVELVALLAASAFGGYSIQQRAATRESERRLLIDVRELSARLDKVASGYQHTEELSSLSEHYSTDVLKLADRTSCLSGDGSACKRIEDALPRVPNRDVPKPRVPISPEPSPRFLELDHPRIVEVLLVVGDPETSAILAGRARECQSLHAASCPPFRRFEFEYWRPAVPGTPLFFLVPRPLLEDFKEKISLCVAQRDDSCAEVYSRWKSLVRMQPIPDDYDGYGYFVGCLSGERVDCMALREWAGRVERTKCDHYAEQCWTDPGCTIVLK